MCFFENYWIWAFFLLTLFRNSKVGRFFCAKKFLIVNLILGFLFLDKYIILRADLYDYYTQLRDQIMMVILWK